MFRVEEYNKKSKGGCKYQKVSGGPRVRNSKTMIGVSMMELQKMKGFQFPTKNDTQTTVSIYGFPILFSLGL